MMPVLEAVPNISEGRDLAKVRHLVDLVEAAGVDVLDASSDEEHHRSVLTFIGEPGAVEEAAFVVARFARDHIDMRSHRGIHPRVGALDVLPFVPVHDLDMTAAVQSAHRVGRRIAKELGIPVYFYARASAPPGRGLAELRRGGIEAVQAGFPKDRRPDLPPDALAPHPTAGVTCVGARPALLAWNVFVSDVSLSDVEDVAASLRERGGGFPGLRALGLRLPTSGRLQVSMNLEDVHRAPPADVLSEIVTRIEARGGSVEQIEIIGLAPDALVLPSHGGRLVISDLGPARVLSHRVAEYVERRTSGIPETPDGTE
jgi:glutamate formiminotransferase